MMFYVAGLLAVPAILHACSSLPPGQERKVPLMVSGIKLPMVFTYSQSLNVTVEYPLVQKTSEEAVENLQKYVKKAVSKGIKKFAEESGYGAFVTQIGKQIKAVVYYNPLLCYAMQSEPDTGMPVPTYFPGIGHFCLTKSDTVTKVLYDNKAEAMIDMPQEFQKFIVVLTVIF
ncbi:unnamed protein product [Angiostrongylus costaricensis]|uniref:Cystatin domain-containing protein n=1 Tax=Angiostrongylus costaricensis TaxID=334426 RepID=A0A0R3Q145_ANGCS|nr:unnamed protein product [Angiostrongylus costaricensis]